MVLQVKDFQTNEVLMEFPLVRFMINGEMMNCLVNGGLLETVPEKEKLYKIHVTNIENEVDIEKFATLYTYNFLMDKDGSNPAVITDNSLVFHVVT